VKRTTLVLLIICCFSSSIFANPVRNSAPQISNISVAQRLDGSKRIDIWYDLFDADNDTCDVSICVSVDDGGSFDFSPNRLYLSGDINAQISGTEKHIIWEAGNESIEFDGSQYRIKVLADDGVINIPPNFILVEGGTFYNGVSQVTLSSFYMNKYEVTQAEYIAVMGEPAPDVGYGGGPNYPVYRLSWFNEIKFCNLRSFSEELEPCYSFSSFGTDPANWPVGWNSVPENHTLITCNWSANGYRLPTEMEWMFAARGGNNSNNYNYSGSNNINDVAWHTYNSGGSLHPVGTKAPNELGFYDMSGNAYERVWDITGDYPTDPQTNPTGPESGSLSRVSKGGSCFYSSSYHTIASRNGGYAHFAFIDHGIRLCRNAR